MNLIRWIQRYRELGFVVHPCCPHDHWCNSPGKVPYDPLERKHMTNWSNHEPYSFEQWQEWIDHTPEINLGFLCGEPSNLVCVDIDSDEGERAFRGKATAEELKTWRFITGKGTRYLYRPPAGHVRPAKLAVGNTFIEILGNGRQSVLPPSMHPSGRRYTWAAGFSPKSTRLLPAPSWILLDTEEISSESEDWEEVVTSDTIEGTRNETLTRLAGHLLSPGGLPPGETFLWLKLYSDAHCHPPLDDKEIRSIVNSINGREQSEMARREREIKEIMKEQRKDRRTAEHLWEARNG